MSFSNTFFLRKPFINKNGAGKIAIKRLLKNNDIYHSLSLRLSQNLNGGGALYQYNNRALTSGIKYSNSGLFMNNGPEQIHSMNKKGVY